MTDGTSGDSSRPSVSTAPAQGIRRLQKQIRCYCVSLITVLFYETKGHICL